MLPASNRGMGQNVCEPDVCLTPLLGALVPVPVPYTNVGQNVLAASFVPTVMITGMPALNMASIIAKTEGDEPGVEHPTIMGVGTWVMGNPIVMVAELPGINLTCPATGNNMNVTTGLQSVPSITNVLYTYAAPEATRAPAGRAMTDGEVSALLSDLSVSRTTGDAAVRHRLLEDGVGYVAIQVFSLGVPSMVFTAVRDLIDKGMEELILDLRDNPGGDLRAMVELAGDFLEEGQAIVTVTDGDGDATVYKARSDGLYRFPMTIFVNRGTASAAELFAGCMKSHGRAVIAGERTFGKGSAQALVPATGGGALAMTAALCTLPNGEQLEGTGVLPDIEINV
jgi:carboxyl-terminal processing protease